MLFKLTPETALVKRGKDYTEVPVEQVAIKSGAKVPLDGKVIAGLSSINQAPITGKTSLWLAILADTGATLIVIANALRLLKNDNGNTKKRRA